MDSTNDSDKAEADFMERLQNWASTKDDEGSLQFTPHKGIAIEIPVSCGRWLVPCVESVLAQSSRHWRLYLLSNGSDSQSLRILRSIAALQHPKIVVFFMEKVSFDRARNLLSAASTGIIVDRANCIDPLSRQINSGSSSDRFRALLVS
jgi:FMN phosphatase YigB (HAD superfamily)